VRGPVDFWELRRLAARSLDVRTGDLRRHTTSSAMPRGHRLYYNTSGVLVKTKMIVVAVPPPRWRRAAPAPIRSGRASRRWPATARTAGASPICVDSGKSCFRVRHSGTIWRNTHSR
jgi:hypothetical protein